MILVGEPVVGDRDVTSPQFHQTQSIFFIVGALHTHTHTPELLAPKSKAKLNAAELSTISHAR